MTILVLSHTHIWKTSTKNGKQNIVKADNEEIYNLSNNYIFMTQKKLQIRFNHTQCNNAYY